MALLAARAKTEMLPYNCRTNLIPTDLNLLTEYGDISLPSGKTDGIVSDEDDSSEVSYSANPEAKNKIQVECESGNIQIR